jgi:hypothetical protein
MSEFYPKPKRETAAQLRQSRLVKAGMAFAGVGLVSALVGGCAPNTDQLRKVAGTSGVGQELVQDGYTLVDINGAVVQRAAKVGFSRAAIGTEIEYLGYRMCGGQKVDVCNSQPLAPGALEPVVAVLPSESGDGSLVAVFAGAVTKDLSVGIGTLRIAAGLAANAGINRVRGDIASAPTTLDTGFGAGAAVLPNGDNIRRG